MDGNEMRALVETFEAFGNHRAGTGTDHETVAWMTTQLADRGLTVSSVPVPFDRYQVTSSLTADGHALDHLPVFYEWTGTIDTDQVHLAEVDVRPGGHIGALETATAAGRATGAAALVLATQHENGSLIAVNRELRPHHGLPTVLIAGRDHDQARHATTLRLAMHASLDPATTTNLEARTRPSDHPLLLTTPLTGWFGCAGERGTGIAILLDLVERFADKPLLVLATGAHELDYFGVRQWVATTDITPRAIVHIGASVAVDELGDDGDRQLIRSRVALTNLSGPVAETIAERLDPAGFIVRTATDRWMGESEVFCALERPMVSFTGNGIDFHTPEDTTARVTSAQSLTTVADAIAGTVHALLEN